MDSLGKRATILAKIVLLLSVICLASIFLINGTLGTSTAQSEKRLFENTIPKHIPIKVRIKKEKEEAFNDAKNEKWLRDFVLEVTNTGDKPIYYLSLIITLPEITIPNGTDKIGFSFHYGRRGLHDIEVKAEPDDIPIKPGETHVFNLPESQIVGWEGFRQREKKPDAKKLILSFQLLSFGDGTGFMGNDGLAVPHPPDASSSTGGCRPSLDLNDSGSINLQLASWRSQCMRLSQSASSSSSHSQGETSWILWERELPFLPR